MSDDHVSDAELASLLKSLGPLTVTLDRLQLQMLHTGAVILLPPGIVPGLTRFMDYPVFRVPGLPGPMVGVPGEDARLPALREFVADFDPPVTPEELSDFRNGHGGSRP